MNTITNNKNTDGNVDRGQNADKQTSIKADFLNTWYPPNADFKFPKRITGNRERYFQHEKFDEFKWLHYDSRKGVVFYYYCMKHETKVTGEHNKKSAYIFAEFRSWKNAPQCFGDNEATSCHTVTA